MKERKNAETKLEYLKILQKKENEVNLQIEDFTEEPGCRPGDNFMSVIIRIKIKGIYGNGIPFESIFIRKQHPADDKLVTLVRTRDLFSNEAHLYTDVLPAFNAEFLAPKCYVANFQKIIMEDLTLNNFSVCDRRELLDYAHCQHVVKTLAQFHACSLKLKLNDPEAFDSLMYPIYEVVFPSGTDLKMNKRHCLERGVKLAIESLVTIEPETEEIQKCLKFLRNNLSQVYDMLKHSSSERGTYAVLNHGDVWNNNILFSYDSDTSEISRVKFIDFQGIRKASPALDFLYFMYSSAKSFVLENHYDDLVQLYHGQFLSELQSQVDEAHLEFMSLEWFKTELLQHATYGLFSSLCLVHVLLADDESITIRVAENGQEMDSDIPITDVKSQRIKTIVSHFLTTYDDSD